MLGAPINSASQLRCARQRLGYLPQKPGFYPHYRVAEFLNYCAILKFHHDRRVREVLVATALEHVDLTGQSKRRIRTLSGGMRQRLGLACALLGDPDIVLLDEPTVGLDPEQRIRFREIMASTARTKTVLLSTHQTDDVADLCRRVIVVNSGRIAFTGTPEELASRAQGRVWLGDPGVGREVIAAWTLGDGTGRSIGIPPDGARLVAPTIDDGYLVVCNRPDWV